MKLTIGEFSMFDEKAKIEILADLGKPVFEKNMNGNLVKIISLFSFYAIVYSMLDEKPAFSKINLSSNLNSIAWLVE